MAPAGGAGSVRLVVAPWNWGSVSHRAAGIFDLNPSRKGQPMSDRRMYLNAPFTAEALVPSSTDPRTLDMRVLRVGSYRHPRAGWELAVDQQRLVRMAETTNSMIAAGVAPDITVDHGQSARDKLGAIVGAKVDGDWLVLSHRFADDESLALARRVGNVSVEIEPDLVDGKGRHWADAIMASSLVRNPIVPGQSNERMAASYHSGDVHGTRPSPEAKKAAADLAWGHRY